MRINEIKRENTFGFFRFVYSFVSSTLFDNRTEWNFPFEWVRKWNAHFVYSKVILWVRLIDGRTPFNLIERKSSIEVENRTFHVIRRVLFGTVHLGVHPIVGMVNIKFDSRRDDMQLTDCQQTVSLVYSLYRLYRPSNCFTPHSESIRRENILSPLNDMQFTDCQQTVSLVYGLYRLYRPSNCFTPHSESIRRENILSPLNEMQFTDCQRTVSLVYGLYRPYRPSNCFTPHSESIRREMF